MEESAFMKKVAGQLAPVVWQFSENGKWYTGFDTNNHRTKTEEAGYPIRELCTISEALAGYAVRDARIAELEAKTRTAMGVGSGSGNLFVYGDHDSIKAAQKIVIERDQLRAQVAKQVVLTDADHSEDVRTMVLPDGYALVSLESIGQFPEINPANYGDDEVIALNNWAIDLVLAASPPAKGDK